MINRNPLSYVRDHSENNFMDLAAGIFNKLIVATPFLLVTTLGLKAREQRPTFHYTACSAIEDQKFSAYIPVVRESEASFDPNNFINEKAARKIAKDWIQGAKEGKLKPLAPLAISDSSRDGVKAEIIHDAGMVAESLNYAASAEADSHHYEGAVKDSVLAIGVLKVPRLFDFSSMSVCTMLVRRSLAQLDETLPKTSPVFQAEMVNQIKQANVSKYELETLKLQARSVLLKAEESPNIQPSNFAKLEGDLSMATLPTLESLKKARHQPFIKNTDEDLMDLVNEYRLGYSSALETNLRVDKLLSTGKPLEAQTAVNPDL